VKSEASTPVTASENTTLYAIVFEFVIDEAFLVILTTVGGIELIAVDVKSSDPMSAEVPLLVFPSISVFVLVETKTPRDFKLFVLLALDKCISKVAVVPVGKTKLGLAEILKLSFPVYVAH
jgi:hypothetical protein